MHKAGSALPSYQWHMVTVSYTHNRMKSSQLSCYLNGCPVLNADVTLPATDDVCDSSPLPTSFSSFSSHSPSFSSSILLPLSPPSPPLPPPSHSLPHFPWITDSSLQVFDKCFLGSTPVSTADVVFQGQMAAAYLFKEPLSVEAVAALHKLGPGYKVQV